MSNLLLIKDLGRVPRPSGKGYDLKGAYLCGMCFELFEARHSDIRSGHTNGCRRCADAKSGNTRRVYPQSELRIRDIWYKMVYRCSPDHGHKDYAGNGVVVCQAWECSFFAFRDWAIKNGYSDKLTIDRVDPYGNYEPSKMIEQANNKRDKGTIAMSGYTGVCKKTDNCFAATLMFNNTWYYIGTHKTASLASLARNLFIIVNRFPNRINGYVPGS